MLSTDDVSMAQPVHSQTVLDKRDVGQESVYDPSVIIQRPAPGKSQDISHILSSSFKNIYSKDIMDKDMFTNLLKTRSGQGSYNDQCVEELQQANAEYTDRIQEADMLENHIIQARAQAAAKERLAFERMTENISNVKIHQGLIKVQPAFSWCVDEGLLIMYNLIAPRDFLPSKETRFRAPTTIKAHYAKPTIASTMKVAKEPQDDGYTLFPKQEVNELNESLTVESTSDAPKIKPPAIVRPKRKEQLSTKEKYEAEENLQRLRKPQNFLRNPHFLPPNGMSLIQPKTKATAAKDKRKGMEGQSSADDPATVFLANPSEVVFSEYVVGHIYETTLELRNLTSSSRSLRVIPPTTPYFSIGLGRFPGEGGVVAPGMSCKFTVQFAPSSLANYEDFLVVRTQAEQPLVVRIAGRRPPPILTLPRVLNCGYCLVGGVKFVEFLCQNVGLSPGTFCIMPKDQWPPSNLRSVARNNFSEQPPFAVSPSFFALRAGESTVMEVAFFPTTTGQSSQVFVIVCDNCQVKDISIKGEGQLIALELVSVSGEKELPVLGEVRDFTADHFVRFSSCNPHSVQQRKVIVRNNVHLELPFHWQITKPSLYPLLPWETPAPSHIHFLPATEDAFHVSPQTGILAPCQDQEFLFTFTPKELGDYHSVCQLVVRDVPELPPEPGENSALRPVPTGSSVRDVVAMEIETKGSTEPYQVVLEPYVLVIPGEIFICTKTHWQFKMWNHSKTFVRFRWKNNNCSSHKIEVEPSTGRIEENERFDFTLFVTGGKAGKVMSKLVCHIEHHQEPVVLVVHASFKGPTVTINVPNVNFGLLRLGEQKQTTLRLTNTTHLEASWSIEESHHDQEDTQISVDPCRGVLPPLGSSTVVVSFRAHCCQEFQTELVLAVKDGTECHLSVEAVVQSPQVCLLNCQLVLSELYVGVPAKGKVTLFNQTMLPSRFRWLAQLQGKQAPLCTVTFDPSSGTLGPHASIVITVHFTSHTELELTEVLALCKVEEMRFPLVLGIVTSKSKRLCVSYSLPSVGAAPSGESPSKLLLDFGGDIVLKKAVTKQLQMTNQTAIPALFTIEAQYFKCHASKQKNPSDRGFRYVKKPIHSIQAQKMEENAEREFVNRLLAHGKGAAFFVLPSTGVLGPFETQTVTVTAYNDMWGKYRDNLVCKVGYLEPTLIPMRMSVKGCPLYFQMTGPNLDDQNQVPVIRFGTHVSGGDTASRAVRINNPTMFDIRLDWETYNVDENNGKLVDLVVSYGNAFPLKDADGNEVVMSEAESNADVEASDSTCTPDSEGASASIQSQSDVRTQDPACDDAVSSSDNKDVITVYIRPHVGTLSDYPYCVTPQQLVIPSKSVRTVHVSFTPLTLSDSTRESTCLGAALGFISLDSKMAVRVPGKVRRAHGLDLDPVRMDLLATVKPAVLSVQMEEDDGVLDFHASAGGLVRADAENELVVQGFDVTRTLQLKNTSEMPLHFHLGTQTPFTVLKPQPRAQTSTSSNSRSADSEFVALQPQKSLQVKVTFHCSLPLLEHADHTDVDVPPGVTLIRDASGQRELRFQRNLLVHYSNSTLQTVPLRAHLHLSTLRLSTGGVSCGFCYVGDVKIVDVTFYCRGAQTYWKSVIVSDEGDPHVFKVTPDSGLLGSQDHQTTSCSQCLQIGFRPCANREFRATVVIQSPLVKTPLTLQLQGAGSFDEVYKSD